MELFEDEKTIEIFTSTLQVGICQGPSCGATITWGQIPKTLRLMCFNGPLSAQRILRAGSHEGRATVFLPFDANHWATCPDAAEFKRKRGTR